MCCRTGKSEMRQDSNSHLLTGASNGGTLEEELREKMYEREPAYALKSAEAVAAWSAGVSRHAAQTAPLCPSNVPIQSPVSPFRNIGFPSAKTKLKIHESLSPANM
jgi:hypothetical protein